MNATKDSHDEYVAACGLAVDAAAASAAARAAWKKLQALERKASELFAEAMRAHERTGDTATAEGLGKASRNHWHASYAAEAGYQKAYERKVDRGLEGLLATMAEAILDDENGIGERGYEALLDVARFVSGELADSLRDRVDATDGRFYLPSVSPRT